MSNVNENIRKFRKFRGLSQQKLGSLVGKSTNVVSNWENGLHSPDLDTIAEICKVLSVTPNQIFGWEECPEYEQWNKEAVTLEIEMKTLEERKKDLEKRLKEYQAQIIKRTKNGKSKTAPERSMADKAK